MGAAGASPGVAMAAVIAEAVGVALGLVLLMRTGRAALARAAARASTPAAMRRTLAVNADIMIRTVALVFAFAFFTSQGARAGDTTLAANAMLYNLFLVGAFFLDGFATAAEQLCGQALGSRDEAGFRGACGSRSAGAWRLACGERGVPGPGGRLHRPSPRNTAVRAEAAPS
jgi:MATE family multidrug resistance protein